MFRFLKQVIKSERGQALPIVLALLVLGGLTIVPVLNHAATSLNAGRTIEKSVNGLYAAEAGVEDTIWRLKSAISPSQQLPQNINRMQVTIQTENKGPYTLYSDELVHTEGHSDYLSVDGEMAWDGGAGAYKYITTVTWQPHPGTPVIHLVEVGTRLPLNYSYQTGSAGCFPNNLSTNEPTEILDGQGAQMLTWELASPYPSVSESSPAQTQTFYVTGVGNQEGDYTWVVANSRDIREVGEITGTLYRITSTATCPENGEITAKVVADVLVDGAAAYIISWRILK